MEDYELTVKDIYNYKDKACEFANNNCVACEALYGYNGNRWCCFDTVARFVDYANKHKL